MTTWSYTDHQGRPFVVEAASQSEADTLASFEANARDEFIKQGEWRADHIDQVIQNSYAEAFWWHNDRIAGDSCKKCGLDHKGGCMSSQPLSDYDGSYAPTQQPSKRSLKQSSNGGQQNSTQAEEHASSATFAAAASVILVLFCLIGGLCSAIGDVVQLGG